MRKLDGTELSFKKGRPNEVLFEIASRFKEEYVLWCSEEARHNLNIDVLEKLFDHHRLMLSYGDVNRPFLTKDIGYIEDTPFVKIPGDVTYPTWQMHSYVGGIHATVLNEISTSVNVDVNFDFLLNSIAKKAQAQGLICLSEPQLVKDQALVKSLIATREELYTFVSKHYKKRWLFFLFIMHAKYSRTYPVVNVLRCLFKKNSSHINIDFNKIVFETFKPEGSLPLQIDVVIPTLGREKYLVDVLNDFKNQTLLPKKVIVVEQNPDINSSSELDYLYSENWPFEIDHMFIHTTGVCNARNLALKKCASEWVFLFDDDGRLTNDTLQEIQKTLFKTNAKCINMSYLQKGEKETNVHLKQWPYFGAGCSVIHKSALVNVSFDPALEHGYGEDVDFGMQIRNNGADILYAPNIKITHLKAPIGGFRSKKVFPWQIEGAILPKPSPQVMYHREKNTTNKQLIGYKWVLFFKFYKENSIKNPISYIRYFRSAWEASQKWAQKLPFND
ncbi:glycosyltransferase family 2 protein [Dokdonia donghaensis]|uniref:glycosyltransferase family 2 protein n=1 Tax=Dokdonia donghaensis TaxID=326320 RepID=UPI0007DCF320|nr:glycosyltransferase family A protein [Dokdonia donghaensis]ANH60441.1 Glycosyl transferase family 2 [Dokdonia donghaensis DSW-1]